MNVVSPEIRRATTADLPAIAAIQAAASEAAHWNVPDYLGYDCVVAAVRNRVAAFLVCRTVAPGEREVLNLAVSPGFRREGIARALLEAEFQGHPGAHFLEVRASNIAGREFYRRLGFTEAGVRPAYYESPHESGIVMNRHSC